MITKIERREIVFWLIGEILVAYLLWGLLLLQLGANNLFARLTMRHITMGLG